MWTLSRDDVATKPRQRIQSKKFMFTMIWNPSEFYAVERLANDTRMNTDYFVRNILIFLEQMIFPWKRAPREKRLMVSVDNWSVHTSRGSTDWLEKHGISACQTNSIYLIWPLVTCTCFLQWKKISNGFSWLTRTSVLSASKRFWGI
jgi:hypothetical protein